MNSGRISNIRSILAALLTSSALAASPAFAQSAAEDTASSGGDIIVTAQKREQNLQDVPISIQALGETRLENAQVSSFDDYAKMLPSVSFQSFGPSQAQISFRGVTSGGDGLRIGPLPTAGLYVDEIPVSTIAGAVDFHIYDVARVEALSGPQGTLFGASSLSGTLRIITNKPDATAFSGAVDAEINKYGKGDMGGQMEGYLNLPLSERAALRVVGFYRKEGGYIDNIPGTRTFTLDDAASDPDNLTNLTVSNGALVENDYNDIETYGGRAALKIDLDEDWTVTPQVIYQRQRANGGFLFDPRKGDLKVTDYLPSKNLDRWYQAALTIEGKLSDWDIVYSGGYFERKVDSTSDYSYYTVAYDTYGYYATYFPDANGNFIDPTQNSILGDKFTKQTHEIRVSSPATDRLRLTAGLFYQRQTDKVSADYQVQGISSIPTPIWFTPYPTSIYLDSIFHTRIDRVDRDYAAFGQAEFDITPDLTLTAGVRGFIAKNTIFGYSGLFSTNYDPAVCVPTAQTDRPCNNVDKKNDESGVTYKFNLRWKVTDDAMVYATLSKGFRPGGNNRRASVNPFKSDTLTNYEVGAKTSIGPFTFNAAAFYQKWKDLQFGLVPLNNNGVTNTYNAGDARIYGAEGDISVRAGGLSLTAAGTYIDAKLTTDFCSIDPATLNVVCVPGETPAASKGTRLPIQPKFKGNLTARYEFPIGLSNTAFVQGSMLHQGGTRSFLTDADYAAVGPTKGFTSFDFSIGTTWDKWKIEAYIQNAFDKRGQLTWNTACATSFCGPYARIYPIKPQLFGLKLGTEF
ncbi:TonB-dependent receptor [Sphingobium boeckii]|uniref:Outer membrane receptor protein involved in Fe transport n=1 Tax=Sphingobium boeckii TaxID=1082345 RepID=A0A7W9AF51_9SPHN|nr:TonB-dependent receptor [Sphingobium boeckii]MBB5684402.1 outer membrane receptor protein involved in Fe transport [Sphingobium boeckii]